MSRRATLVAAVLLVAAGPAAGAAVAGAGSASVAGPAGAPAAQADGFDHSVVAITVAADGSARWTFRYERALETDGERSDFEAFAAEFRENETDLYRNFRSEARSLVADGGEATGRGMAATGFDRDAYVRTSLTNDIGVVEMAFTWEGFARADGDGVVVGDVFEGGLYLGPNQDLVVRPGPDLAFQRVDPAGTQSDPESLAESSSVTWTGERQFTDRRPRVAFRPAAAVGSAATPTATPTETPAAADGDAVDGGGSAVPWLLLAVAVLGVGGVIAWQRGLLPTGERDGDEPPAGAAGAAAGPDGSAIPEAELLSDEDRIVAMLEETGGRMKQSEIVESTEWSKSKVSVLLSEMEDEGTVSKLRVGRENVVSLDGHEPEAAKSPLDDE